MLAIIYRHIACYAPDNLFIVSHFYQVVLIFKIHSVAYYQVFHLSYPSDLDD